MWRTVGEEILPTKKHLFIKKKTKAKLCLDPLLLECLDPDGELFTDGLFINLWL